MIQIYGASDSDRATILAPVRWVVAGREAVFSA